MNISKVDRKAEHKGRRRDAEHTEKQCVNEPPKRVSDLSESVIARDRTNTRQGNNSMSIIYFRGEFATQ